MSPIEWKPSYVEINGIDLSAAIVAVEPLEVADCSPFEALETGTFQLNGYWDDGTVPAPGLDGSSWTFEVTWDQLHPDTQAYLRALFAAFRARRLSRMRTAYRSRKRHR